VPAAEPRKEKAPVPPRERTAPQRLGYKRERALAELPKQIEGLQAEIARLQSALADPDLYRRNAADFQAKTRRLSAAQTELEAAETEWLELEMLKEELGG
jgi:ATP-binding cassette subfamily F protein uup